MKADLGRSVVRRTEEGNLEEIAELSHHCQKEGGEGATIFCCLNTARFVIISALSESPVRLRVGSITVKVTDTENIFYIFVSFKAQTSTCSNYLTAQNCQK